MDGLLIINKPKGLTSHDVVAKLRKILSIQKIGHTGTLDPDATGVLCICVGKATKLAEYATEVEKEYRVVMRLGVITDTQDATGRVIKETENFEITRDEIEEAFRKFTGSIKQIPPMYSAVKVGGTPLYKLARKGKEISREARDVYIKEIKFTEYSGALVKFDVVCSKGTYIRTLCFDIGNYLGVGAHMYSLERLRSGDFHMKDAVTIEEVEELILSGTIKSKMISMDQAVAWMPFVRIKDSWNEGVRHGRALISEAVSETKGDFAKDSKVRIINNEGELISIGIAQYDSKDIIQGYEEKIFKIEKVLV